MKHSTSLGSCSSVVWADGSPTSTDTANGGHAASETYEGSEDTQQRPSSCASSCSVEPTNLMRAEGSSSHNNNYHEIEMICLTTIPTILDLLEKISNTLDRMENCMVAIQLAANGPVNNTPALDNSQDAKASDKNENKIKGLLGSYYTMVDKLFLIIGCIFLSYAKSQGDIEDTWMVIFIGISIASSCNLILLIHASYFKENGSIEDFDSETMKWLLLLVLAFLYAVFYTRLAAFANTSTLVSWLLGIIGLSTIVLGWAWFFRREWPKILEDMKTDGMSDERADSDLPPQV